MEHDFEECEVCDNVDMVWTESPDGEFNLYWCKSTNEKWAERI